MKITRSFSRKINLGNYETADFYCEMEDELTQEQIDSGNYGPLQLAGDLHEMCKEEVELCIEDFLEEREITKKEASITPSAPIFLDNKPKLNFTDEPK